MPAHKCFIEQDNGIYGTSRFEAFRPSETCPFAVYKDGAGNWLIGHLVTGLKIMSIVGQRVRRDKKHLLEYLARMEVDCPEAVAAMWCVTQFPMPKEYRDAGQALVDWARAQR